jgi:hypothetical protein
MDIVVPRCDEPAMERRPLLDLSSGYVARAIDRFPKAGAHGPWEVAMAYEKDVERLRHGAVQDPALRFTSGAATPRVAA